MNPKLPQGSPKCQCGACGRLFAGVSAFDKHRVGAPASRTCLDPEKVTRRDGKKVFERASSGHWRIA